MHRPSRQDGQTAVTLVYSESRLGEGDFQVNSWIMLGTERPATIMLALAGQGSCQINHLSEELLAGLIFPTQRIQKINLPDRL